MNKRYMDFVPVDKKSASKRAAQATPLTVRKGAPKRITPKKPVVKDSDEIPLEEMFGERARPAGVSTGLSEPKYGVIEDYRPKFVRTEVAKRPLGAKASVKKSAVKSESRPVMRPATKPAVRPAMKPAMKPAMRPAVKAETKPVAKLTAKPAAKPAVKPATAKSNYIAGPRITKFLNTNKIEKRPLSGGSPRRMTSVESVNRSAVAEAKIEKRVRKSPERIIVKPEKDSKAGMIIAVILTIILGAAAGTVAFLLLPK